VVAQAQYELSRMVKAYDVFSRPADTDALKVVLAR
jgi:hypothetical protein